MNLFPLAALLHFYGIFLMACGIISVVFIGMKAKTALASGGTAGLIALLIGNMVSTHPVGATWAGIALSLVLLIVFSWRSAKTLFKTVELIPTSHPDLKGKCIAFLIISLMAVVSMMVLMLQIIGLH